MTSEIQVVADMDRAGVVAASTGFRAGADSLKNVTGQVSGSYDGGAVTVKVDGDAVTSYWERYQVKEAKTDRKIFYYGHWATAVGKQVAGDFDDHPGVIDIRSRPKVGRKDDFMNWRNSWPKESDSDCSSSTVSVGILGFSAGLPLGNCEGFVPEPDATNYQMKNVWSDGACTDGRSEYVDLGMAVDIKPAVSTAVLSDYSYALRGRSVRPLCRSVTVAGTAYRYAFVRSGRDHKPLVLLDTGGPGGSLFGAAWPSEALKQLIGGYDVLMLEEPWVQAAEPAGCSDALTAWYDTVHAQWPTRENPDPVAPVASTVAKRCQLWQGRWGWTPQRYADVVTSVLERTGRKLQTFVGFSFASTRLAYLESAGFRFSSVTLISPFPVGAPAGQYVRARQRVLEGQPVFARALLGTTPAGRSLPLSATDLEAARVQAQYASTRTRTRLLMGHRTDAVLVGQMSDMLFGRYGVDSVSPSVLAYWDETCPALHGWPSPRGSGSPSGGTGLAGELLGVCDSRDEGPVGVRGSGSIELVPRSLRAPCVVASREDGVVPIDLLRRWAAGYGWPVAVRSGRHASVRFLRACEPVRGRRSGHLRSR